MPKGWNTISASPSRRSRRSFGLVNYRVCIMCTILRNPSSTSLVSLQSDKITTKSRRYVDENIVMGWRRAAAVLRPKPTPPQIAGRAVGFAPREPEDDLIGFRSEAEDDTADGPARSRREMRFTDLAYGGGPSNAAPWPAPRRQDFRGRTGGRNPIRRYRVPEMVRGAELRCRAIRAAHPRAGEPRSGYRSGTVQAALEPRRPGTQFVRHRHAPAGTRDYPSRVGGPGGSRSGSLLRIRHGCDFRPTAMGGGAERCRGWLLLLREIPHVSRSRCGALAGARRHRWSRDRLRSAGRRIRGS
jgi:hypothetical protein